ncbi:MAG: hypothetical protein ABI413_01130 [Ktedonobacteraceae bacterium]
MSPAFEAVIYTQITNGDEKRDERLQAGLNAKPTLPQGFPTGRTITTAGQIAAHLGDGFPERLRGHSGGRLTGLRCHNGEDIGIQHLRSGLLWFQSDEVSPLQQAHRQWRQEAEQALQPINTLHLALFPVFRPW